MKSFSSINVKFLLQVLLFNILLLVSFWKTQEINEAKDYSKEIFKIPTISQKNQLPSQRLLMIHHIYEFFPVFFNKYKFSDKIQLELKREDALLEEYIREWDVEDSSVIFSADGFQLKADYSTNINVLSIDRLDSNAYYPVFIINETKSIKLLHGKNSYLFAIQEAKDSQGFWRPIEMKGSDFCGNGRWALKVHPNEFAVFAMPKYAGNYETDIRVRLKNGDNVLISNIFRGKINYNQFHLKEGTYFHKIAKEHPLNFKSYWFYDAFPLDFEEY